MVETLSVASAILGADAVKKDPESADISSERIRFRSKPGTKAVHADRLGGKERTELGMAEVQQSITEEQFLAEVDRCFS